MPYRTAHHLASLKLRCIIGRWLDVGDGAVVFRKAATESGAAFGRLGNALLDLPFIGFKWLAIGSMGAAGLSALLLVPVLLARVGYFLYSAIWYRTACDLNWVTITQFEFSFPCEIAE